MKILVLAYATDVWYTSLDSRRSSYNINYVDFIFSLTGPSFLTAFGTCYMILLDKS